LIGIKAKASRLEVFLNHPVKRPQFITFFICFLLLLIRGWERLAYPVIWAEDGTLGIAPIYNEGFFTIFQSETGTYLPLLKASGLIQYLVPTFWIPFALTFLCFFITAALSSKIAQKEYRDLIPNDIHRIMIGICLVMLPALHEVAGNVCNLPWILTNYVVLILIKPFKVKITLLETLLAVLFITNGAQSVLLFPMFLTRIALIYRSKQIRDQNKAVPEIFLFSVTLAITLLNVMDYKTSNGSRGMAEESIFQYFSQRIDGLFYGTINTYVTQPILGADIGSWIASNYLAVWWIGAVIGLGLIVWFGLKCRSAYEKHVYLALLSMVGGIPLLFIARKTAHLAYSEPHAILTVQRYAYNLPLYPLILWVLIILKLFLLKPYFKKNSALMIFLFLVFYCVVNASYFWLPSKRPENYNWKLTAELIDTFKSTGNPLSLEVPIAPKGWTFTLHSKTSSEK